MRGVLIFLLILGFGILGVALLQFLPKPIEDVSTSYKLPATSLTTPLIRSTDPRQGPPGAPVTLIEFGDFACPACAAIQPTIHDLFTRFPGKIFHVWKDVPLPIHPHALPAHIAARCAEKQGKFWEYHDRLFARQSPFDETYDAIAQELGLGMTEFTACRNDGTILKEIQENFAEAELLELTGVPTFFLNGKRLADEKTKEQLEQTIEDFLQNK